MSRTIQYEHLVCANCHSTLSVLKPVLLEEVPACKSCGKNWFIEQPLKWINFSTTDGKFISFHLLGASASGKTHVWAVQNRDNGTDLGQISWFGRWRKYAFEPYATMVFEETCLRDIAQFCQQETVLQRKQAARNKAAKA